MEVLVAGPQEGPHGAGSLVDVVHLSLAGAVPEEGPVEAGIRVLHQLHLQRHRGNSVRASGKRCVLSTRERFNAPLGWLTCATPGSDGAAVLCHTGQDREGTAIGIA